MSAQGPQQQVRPHPAVLQSLAEPADRRRLPPIDGLALHLQHAREDERQRLARDLHDELGALLTSAKLEAAALRQRLVGAPGALERLARLVAMLDSGLALKRRIVEDLRPSDLATLGLVPALERLGGEFARSAGWPVCRVLSPVGLSADADLALYRCAQEALTNIARHAHAQRVYLLLGRSGGRAVLEVRDDGIGFDASTLPRGSYGLAGMRQRLEGLGGWLVLTVPEGGGTCLRASLPGSA
jgi:signal transduction histidine kinase